MLADKIQLFIASVYLGTRGPLNINCHDVYFVLVNVEVCI